MRATCGCEYPTYFARLRHCARLVARAGISAVGGAPTWVQTHRQDAVQLGKVLGGRTPGEGAGVRGDLLGSCRADDSGRHTRLCQDAAEGDVQHVESARMREGDRKSVV